DGHARVARDAQLRGDVTQAQGSIPREHVDAWGHDVPGLRLVHAEGALDQLPLVRGDRALGLAERRHLTDLGLRDEGRATLAAVRTQVREEREYAEDRSEHVRDDAQGSRDRKREAGTVVDGEPDGQQL